MTVYELLGTLLSIVGLAFAFETPRKWFLRGLRLHLDGPSVHATKVQQLHWAAQPSRQFSEQPTAPVTLPAEYISVKEIVDAINGAPPFQQQAVGAHYVGITVNWEGFLRHVKQDPRDSSLVQVNLITDNSEIVGYSIWFSVHPDKVPEIKTLHRDSKLCVAGTIQSASGPGLCVTIQPVSIKVLERTA